MNNWHLNMCLATRRDGLFLLCARHVTELLQLEMNTTVRCHITHICVNITAFGRKLTLFSAIPLSRFSLKMFRIFCVLGILRKKSALCALLSVKWTSDDLATSFHCSAKIIRSAKLDKFGVGLFCLFAKSWPRSSRDKDRIPGYRCSGTIRVASRRCTVVGQLHTLAVKILTTAFYAFSSALS